MFAITPDAYREFRDYIDALPDAAFEPKPGDLRPYRRARALPREKGRPNPSADRDRNHAIFSHKKVAHIRTVRAKIKETRPAIN